MLQIGDKVPHVAREKPAPIWSLGTFRWHIVTTKGQQEKATVARVIEELEVETYLPLEHAKVRAGRNRIREIQRPMFQNYFFVHIPEDEDAWRRVRGIRGVEDFLSFADGRPKWLADAAVLAIRWHEGVVNGKWLQQQVLKQESPFEIGQQVWADILPFKRMLAAVTGFDARGHVKVLLDMEVLGRKEWPMEPRLLHEVID